MKHLIKFKNIKESDTQSNPKYISEDVKNMVCDIFENNELEFECTYSDYYETNIIIQLTNISQENREFTSEMLQAKKQLAEASKNPLVSRVCQLTRLKLVHLWCGTFSHNGIEWVTLSFEY